MCYAQHNVAYCPIPTLNRQKWYAMPRPSCERSIIKLESSSGVLSPSRQVQWRPGSPSALLGPWPLHVKRPQLCHAASTKQLGGNPGSSRLQARLRASPSSMAASVASRAAATAAAFSSDSFCARRRAAEIFAAAAARGSPPPPLPRGLGLGLPGPGPGLLGLPEPRPPRQRSLAGGGVAPLPLAWPGAATALSVSTCFLRERADAVHLSASLRRTTQQGSVRKAPGGARPQRRGRSRISRGEGSRLTSHQVPGVEQYGMLDG